VKTGIKGIPLERGFRAVDYYFQYDLEKKDIVKLAKQYVKNNYSKEDAKQSMQMLNGTLPSTMVSLLQHIV